MIWWFAAGWYAVGLGSMLAIVLFTMGNPTRGDLAVGFLLAIAGPLIALTVGLAALLEVALPWMKKPLWREETKRGGCCGPT